MSIAKRIICMLLVFALLVGYVPPLYAEAEELETVVSETEITDPSEEVTETTVPDPSEELPVDTTVPAATEESNVPQETVISEETADSEGIEAFEEMDPVFDSTALVKLEITTMPNKCWYQVGDALDLTGITLYAEDTNGLSQSLNAEDVTVVSGDTSAAGRVTVLLSYGNLTASFGIYVHTESQYGEVLQDSAHYPESAHSYSNSSDISYIYTCPNAVSLRLVFSGNTFVESNYDYIWLYDGNDTQLGKYTGSTLAGTEVTVTGDTVRIRLTSDGSVTKYGFSLDAIYADVRIFVHEPANAGVYTEPLCFEDGYTTHTCWICGAEFVEKDPDSATHTFEDGFCAVCGLPENQISSGVIEESVVWAITEDNTLYVSGNGEIPNNYTWDGDISEATALVIGEGITRLGSSAFYGKSNLQAVSLPDTLTAIGDSVFYGCSGLTEIRLPEGLESIGSNAFRNCTGLTSMYIPASVTTITGTSYSTSPFYGCSSAMVLYCAASEPLSGWNSAWNYRASGSALVTNYGYTVEEYAYWIGFDNTAETIVIDNGITIIPAKAFYNCTSLTSITLPEGLTAIGDYAFYGCSALTEIAIPDTVTSIGSYAFAYCSGMTALELPDSLTTLGDRFLYSSSGVTEITFPASLTDYRYVSGYSVLYGSSVATVTFAEGTTAIADYALYSVSSMTAVHIPDSVTAIGDYACYGCNKLTSVTLPDNVTTIGSYTFYGCNKMASMTLPDGLTMLGNYAFYNCSALTEISIPDGVTEIPDYAFQNCSKLTKVTLHDGVTRIGSRAFYGCTALVELTIPGSVTQIADYAFYNCSKLASVILPEGLTTLGTYAFYNCAALTEINIPGGVVAIPAYAFQSCTGLTTVTLNEGLTSIGSYAFQKCTALTAITLPESVTSLSESIFYGCTGLTELRLPASVITINRNGYRGPLDGSSITKVTFGDGFPIIPAYILSYYSSSGTYASKITEVVFEAPEKILSVDAYAFRNCVALERIALPDAVESIYSYAFYGCNNLAEVVWPQNLTFIDSYAFQGCAALANVILPDTVETVGSYAFQGCSSAAEVVIPANATVNSYAFKDCSGLRTLTIGDNAHIYGHVFNNCMSLTSITMGSNVTLEKDAFYGVTISGSCGDTMTWGLNLGSGVLTLRGSGDMADYTLDDPAPWYDFRSMIAEIEFDSTVTDIGAYAFVDCSGLEALILPDFIRTISESSFYNCENICYVEIPDGVQTIGKDAFDGCDALEEVVFLGDAPVMEDNCFGTSDATVYYPETASGFIARIFEKFIQYIWTKWDDTVPEKDVVILLDTSGSMDGKTGTLSSASGQLISAIGGAVRKTNIAVVEYESSATTLSDFTTNNYALIAKVSSLVASGGTHYSNALNRADSLLTGRRSDLKFVIMFSDGQPGDSTSTINSLAAAMRDKGIVIYTVGLGTNTSQRNILINVAGDESRYFEASNIAGLIAAFQELSENFGKSEYATVEMKINDVRHDLFTESYSLCLASDTLASFYLTSGTNDMYDNVVTYALEQDGRYVLSNTTGIFENIRPGDYFQSGKPVYMVMLDAEGNVIERKQLLLDFTDNFKVTYVLGELMDNAIYLEETFIPGNDIPEPQKPEKQGYLFRGWYASENCEGTEFFSTLNYYNRLTVEGNLTLYAKWEEDKGSFILGTDTWGFKNTNSGVFNCTHYEMTAGDLNQLIRDVGLSDRTMLDAKRFPVDDKGNNKWGGSCFGMATSALLIKDDRFQVTPFDSRYENPGEATMYVNSKGDADVGNIESMINYYQFRQYYGGILTARSNYSTTNESGNIKKLIDTLISEETPVCFTIALKGPDATGGHALIAFDLEQTDNGYTFQVYDCALATDRYFTVDVTVSNGVYTASYPEWANRWLGGKYNQIFFKSTLTSADLRSLPLLTAPSILSGSFNVSGSTGYNLTTSYGDFTISNGTASAVIEDGYVVSGDLSVTCYGQTNEFDAADEFTFVIPALAEGTAYTITKTAGGLMNTALHSSHTTDGFYISQMAMAPGTVTINADKTIQTHHETAVEQTIRVTLNSMTTPWYSVKVIGSSTGFTVAPAAELVSVASEVDTTVTIEAKSDFNQLVLRDIPVGTSPAEVKESDTNDCVVEKDNEIIASSAYGYSVVFDSCMGTAVDAQLNVPYGSLVEEPTDPTRVGYIFQGWFKDAEYTEIWDFDHDTVTGDTILYAGWSVNPNYLQSVTFRVPGQDDQIVFIPKGDLLPVHYAPLGSDGEELIWYTTADYASIAWDFENDTVTGDIVLYGKTPLCTIGYITNIEQTLADSKIYTGMVIPEPTGLIWEGYTLCGWYTDAAFTDEWDFVNDVVSENITLHAKWVRNEFDKDGNNTGICIEILNENGYTYTGKVIKPEIVVRDDGHVLTAGTDYTVSYKNNTNARNKEDTSVKLSALPQIIVQGKGNYKSAKKLTKYFTINQADMKDLKITLPQYVTCKSGDKMQSVKATVSTGLVTVSASSYIIRYYTDAELTQAVNGITGPGLYHVTLEAKPDKNGNYSGNFKGVSDAFVIKAAPAAQMLSSAQIAVPKSFTAVAEQPDENAAIKALITKVTLNKVNYLTDEAGIELFKDAFMVTAKDTDGTVVSQHDLGRILMSVGKKTITVSAREGNSLGLVGEKTITITVKGMSLKKMQFQVTFDKTGKTTVTKSPYSGVSQVPAVLSELEEGRDYTVTFKSGKNILSSWLVKNAGSYKLEITGKGCYSGTLSYSFSITKVDITKAYAEGRIKITAPGQAIYSPAGATLKLSASYINERGTRIAMVEGSDYTLSYSGNKAVTDKATMTLGGKGNFSGSLNAKKAAELIYSVTAKPIDAVDVTVTVEGVTVKNSQITGVKYTVYHAGKKVATSQYSGELIANDDDTVTLKITAKEKLYTGTRSLVIKKEMIMTTDTKKVSISLAKDKWYYTGNPICPNVIITDADGNDISDGFTVSYGANTKVGTGTVTITGRPDMGYLGAKTVKFTILPKWAKWIFG